MAFLLKKKITGFLKILAFEIFFKNKGKGGERGLLLLIIFWS